MNEDKPEMTRYRFDDFVIDVSDRQLWRGGERIDLNARYLDALILLVSQQNKLVEKDRLFEEVWQGVVVSDSALTQCVKEIRKQLGDDASNPRYIQTVPRHGYRFIGHAEILESGKLEASAVTKPEKVEETTWDWRESMWEWGAGALGGACAGFIGGMFYGFGLATADGGIGTISTLLVLVTLSTLLGLTGGLGVSLGFAGAGAVSVLLPKMRVALRIVGAAFGGLFVGSLVKLLGVDAFNLFFGLAPAGITGGPEGAVLGAALATGALLGNRVRNHLGSSSHWFAAAGAGFMGAMAGALIPVTGGRLLAGSLDLLAKSFSESNLQLDRIGPFFGEIEFGLATQMALGGFEGLLFCGCVVGALTLMNYYRHGNADPWDV